MKKAVVIMGLANSGKTTTIKSFLCKYGRGYPYSQLRNSKHYFKRGNGYSIVWIQGQSPSETGKPLVQCKGFNPDAEFLIVAEQTNGVFMHDTLNTLKRNKFNFKIFEIDGNYSPNHWKKINKNSGKSLQLNNNMKKRADDIFNHFK